MSPATNIPSTLVLQDSLERINPDSSVLIRPFKYSIFGFLPIAINNPEILRFLVSPLLFTTSILSKVFVPLTEEMLDSNTNSTFSLFLIRLTVFSSPLNSFLLWIRYTFSTILDKYKVSSKAVFPPPTTATVFPLKKLPSHVAQNETPFPTNSFSFGRFKVLFSNPLAIIIAFAVYSPTEVLTFLSSPSSTESTFSNLISAPSSSACFFKLLEKSNPLI